MFSTTYIYVPSMKHIIKINEGSGDNLSDDDIAQGYVDYIYYEVFELGYEIMELDGGMIMLDKLFQDQFKSTDDAIPYVLDMAYHNDKIDYIKL